MQHLSIKLPCSNLSKKKSRLKMVSAILGKYRVVCLQTSLPLRSIKFRKILLLHRLRYHRNRSNAISGENLASSSKRRMRRRKRRSHWCLKTIFFRTRTETMKVTNSKLLLMIRFPPRRNLRLWKDLQLIKCQQIKKKLLGRRRTRGRFT